MTNDEKRRKAITDWWERQSLRDFIARLRSRVEQHKDIGDGE